MYMQLKSIPVLCFCALISASLPPQGEARDLYDFAGTPLLEAPVTVAASGQPAAIRNRVRIGFYNIENFSDGQEDGDQRTPELAASQARLAAAIIGGMNPDVLFLSEIENEQSLRLLNESLDQPFPEARVTSYSFGGQREKLNLGVLSRIAPVSCVEIDFGAMMGPGRPPRGVLRTVFQLEDQSKLLVYTVHLKSNYGKALRNESKRFNAMQLVRENADQMIASEPDTRWEVVVLGDMNVDPSLAKFRRDRSLAPFRDWTDLFLNTQETGWVTVPYRKSSPFRYEPAVFDRILVSPELSSEPWVAGPPKVITQGINTTDPAAIAGKGDHVSDHYPVYVDLQR